MHLLLALALFTPPTLRGLTVAPHFEGVRTQAGLDAQVDEVAALGANQLQIVVQWGQHDIRSSAIAPYQWGTDDEEIRRVIRHAHRRGLGVLLFPIVHVAQKARGEWRGKLVPGDGAAWWRDYRRFILHYAQLAASEGVSLFSVGSELGSMERDEARWRALISEVRAVFPGALTYSANWDHFLNVGFWDALDLVGLNAYHPITTRADATEAELRIAWVLIRDQILRWLSFVRRPLVFTEVGYPSVDGGAVRPYAHDSDRPVDLEEQRRAYAAFVGAWRGQEALHGTYFWVWQGAGGPTDAGYTPRGKPALDVLRGWYRGTPP